MILPFSTHLTNCQILRFLNENECDKNIYMMKKSNKIIRILFYLTLKFIINHKSQKIIQSFKNLQLAITQLKINHNSNQSLFPNLIWMLQNKSLLKKVNMNLIKK